MRVSLFAGATLVLVLTHPALSAGDAADTAAAAVAIATRPSPVPVRGTATFDGAAKIASATWTYERDGKRVEAGVPPKMRVTRMASNVPRIMVKVPEELFAIRIGDELERVFDPPLVIDTDEPVTCSCRMRDDCVEGNTFRCDIEGILEE